MKNQRRTFIKSFGTLTAGASLLSPFSAMANEPTSQSSSAASIPKKRLVMVGTGIRGIGQWGKPVIQRYSDNVEFVGLCDTNAGRLEFAKKEMNLSCPTFTDFDEMMQQTKPDTVIVTTTDAVHHEYIVKSMAYGADVITEKPMTIDAEKCQQIIDATEQTGKKLIVTFNYRYSPHRQKIWELIRNGEIGDVTSVDFHWYLDTSHGADYFRRWHRLREMGGSLWVHKATHHFDLLNYWLDSEPEEVFAMGKLDFYGKNGAYRSTTCRACDKKRECTFFFDITRNGYMMNLYVANEPLDGYTRDGCVFREDVNIFDKMAATIRYTNGTQVSYSLTAYSPYEGYRIAFNGTKGRIDAWIQESNPTTVHDYDEIIVAKNFGKRETYHISHKAGEGGHGGGDYRMLDKIFLDVQEDPYKQSAGMREGTMSCLIGIAARMSCDTGQPIKIADLTTLKPV